MDKSPFPIIQPQEISCCGGLSSPPADPHEKPGYRICRFVSSFVETGVGAVPIVSTRLNFSDFVGRIRARIGILRDSYRVAPGLYGVGNPGQDSPVLATANYKLTFDALRKELNGVDAWVLVLDTRGINVWCASAHQTFGTEELVSRVRMSGLEKVVSHRQIIVPSLGASGVAAHLVKRAIDFKVVWGPIRAVDVPAFLRNDCQVEPAMRKLTFTLRERLVLSPVELSLSIKPALISLAVIFLVSGVGPDIFSFSAAWERGLLLLPAFVGGLLSGAVLLPALLPWLPCRAFYLKGLLAGIAAAMLVVYYTNAGDWLEVIPQIILCLAVSSYAGMNYTGATPFASPSGVEKEMRHAIPLQLLMIVAAMIAWILSPFL